jgi:rubredoxin
MAEGKSKIFDIGGQWPPVRMIVELIGRSGRTFIFSHAHTCAGECGRAIVCDGTAGAGHCQIEDWLCPECDLSERDADHTREQAAIAEHYGESSHETGFAVTCPRHGTVHIKQIEYVRQLALPDDRWVCPRCGAISDFDDDIYNAFQRKGER